MRIRVAHVGGEDPAAVGGLPLERDAIDLERDAAPDGGVAEAELSVDLRHLRRVAEGIRKVAGSHRSAVSVGQRDPTLEVANQRLPADQELVRQRVPGTDLDLTSTNRVVEPILCLGSDRAVIVDHDRLTVHQETKLRVCLRQGEQLIPELHELCPEGLKCRIPFTVPVGVRDDIDRPFNSRHEVIVPEKERNPARFLSSVGQGRCHFSEPMTCTQVSPLSRSIGLPLASR